MHYLKEIVNGLKENKELPSIKKLIDQYKLYVKFQNNTDVLKNAIPWITFSAIEYLNKYIKKDMKVFEFGGGGSTLFFSKRVSQLVTVEHDGEWFKALTEKMKDHSNVKWNGLWIKPEEEQGGENIDGADPNRYHSTDPNFDKFTFKNYAAAIDQYPDQYFDIVLVDGRSRPACMMHSLKKVKCNGLLILDNANRPYYLQRLGKMLTDYKLICDDFGPTPYSASFTQTNIYLRTK